MDVAWIEPPPEQLNRFNPTLVRTLSFGYLPVAIDWILIQCLVDTTMNKVVPGQHTLFYYKLELMTDLDPESLETYLMGGNLLAVIQEDGIGAKNLLMKGYHFLKNELSSYPQNFQTQYWSQPWRIPMLQAYVHLFVLEDIHQASLAFHDAAQYSDAPAYLARLEKRFQRPGGEYEVALKLVKFLENTTRDERVIAELRKKSDNLFKGQYLFELNQAFLNFLRTQQGYQKTESFSKDQMQNYWKDFLRTSQTPEQDPWRGSIYLNSIGKVETTTPHVGVFGLE
jgi:hypothetical protein